MAAEHFIQPKDRQIYILNNLEYVVNELNSFNFKKSKNDILIL